MEKIFLNKEFEFWGTIQNHYANDGNCQGIYIIALPDDFGKVNFNSSSSLDKWKDKNVAVPIEKLHKKWVENTNILYIGKSETNISKRLMQHIDFWNGEYVPAYGGRIIGQIENFFDLEVWYFECNNPSQAEKELLKTFKGKYGKLPFANWRL